MKITGIILILLGIVLSYTRVFELGDPQRGTCIRVYREGLTKFFEGNIGYVIAGSIAVIGLLLVLY